MQSCDLGFYRQLLRGLSVGDLWTLYEKTAPKYKTLAQIIAEELTGRLSGGVSG